LKTNSLKRKKMSKGDIKKTEYFEKVNRLFREYKKVFVVNVDNVSSSQMHQIRGALRGLAIILMGKNTMVRKAMKEVVAENPKLEALLPLIRGNVGLVFTNGDLRQVRDAIVSNRVQAPAKVGLTAQSDIFIPAGSTGMDPNKTSFFQALGISTKVVKGAIEIVSEVCIVKNGQKVGTSQSVLMQMLSLMPFHFGMTVLSIYDDGAVFEPAILDITDESLRQRLQDAIKRVAAISLEIKFPTVASAPHSLVNAYKRILGCALGTDDISFPAVDKIRERLANPGAFAVAASAAAPVATAAAVVEEAKEESDDDMGFGLFD
jgi:large subunit ribosomal protein LP0